MKLLSLLLSAAPVLASFEIPDPERLEIYESGKVHNDMMAKKESFWAERGAAGAFAVDYPTISEHIPCVNGTAGEFRCRLMLVFLLCP